MKDKSISTQDEQFLILIGHFTQMIRLFRIQLFDYIVYQETQSKTRFQL